MKEQREKRERERERERERIFCFSVPPVGHVTVFNQWKGRPSLQRPIGNGMRKREKKKFENYKGKQICLEGDEGTTIGRLKQFGGFDEKKMFSLFSVSV